MYYLFLQDLFGRNRKRRVVSLGFTISPVEQGCFTVSQTLRGHGLLLRAPAKATLGRKRRGKHRALVGQSAVDKQGK